ncbi:hypothetical protein KP509_14G058600 [Ceratopteris richardii]|nr:hypothetical protein KP509_14G058600 [Ceratopteris richardii]
MDKEKYLKTSCKVVAKDLKLVVPEQQEFSSYAPSTNLVVHKNAKLEEEHEEKGFTTSRRNLEDAWTELFENPSNFWDNRNKKKNVNSPDFRHKSRPISLWINDVNIPAWVPERLSSGCLDVSKEDPYPKSERLWQEFFTCPSEWWDNRAKKLSLKSPDFKNKSTGEALWINSTFTPKWVEAQLELYDAKNRTAKADYMDSSWTKVFDKKAAYVSSEGDEFSVI